jgi:peptidoglycan/LPS O-acetylase OafA/YrhL
MEQKLHYRPDIDGLRAVAVLAVLAYHFRISAFHGGFIGVDVFFVISGYLISAIIQQDLHAGKFSLVRFYERRVRRIFPALIVVLIATGIVGYFIFLPAELINFAKSQLAALFSVSNFYFWKQSGYFSAPVETKPLVHTWSLAVEEQFYVFLPIFLYLANKYFRQSLKFVVCMIAAISFAMSAVGAVKFPDSTFYLPHTRAWELLLGVMMTLGVFPSIRTALLRNLATIAGLGLICASIFGFTAYTPFPGVNALPPTLGAALIIAGGETGDSFVGRLLSLKPAVFIGLISYSLYLWHWPVIVYQNMGFFLVQGVSSHVIKLSCVLVSFVLAILSWRFVELPFRSHQKGLTRFTRAQVFQFAAAAAVVVAAIGLTTLAARGFPERYPEKANQMAAYLDYSSAEYFREGTCFISSENKFSDYDYESCLHQDPTKKNELLLGDSHAAQLWYGFSTTIAGVNYMQATGAGCRPTIEQPLIVASDCSHLMNYVFSDYLPSHHIDRLLLEARWREADLVPLVPTLEWLERKKIQVVLFGPMVQYDIALPRLLAFSIRGNDPAIPKQHRVDLRKLDADMAAIAKARGIDYVSFYQSLCTGNSCTELDAKGAPILYDYGHLTREGSVLVAERLRDNEALR